MLEGFLEILAGFLNEALPYLIKLLGASIKWCFYLGKRKFKDIFDEEWNTRIGLFLIVLVIFLIVQLSN